MVSVVTLQGFRLIIVEFGCFADELEPVEFTKKAWSMFIAAIAFEPLAYTHALEEAGFTRDQAGLVAQVGTASFVQKFDAPVTRDYMYTRFSELEARILSAVELRFKDADAKMGLSFKNMDARISKLFIIGGIIIASTVIPALQNLFVWLVQA